MSYPRNLKTLACTLSSHKQPFRHRQNGMPYALALIITPNTAKRHVKHILAKLGATNRVQAVLRARELNVFSPHLKDTEVGPGYV